MDYVVIFLDAVIIVTWFSYAFVVRKERHDPKVRDDLLSYFVIAVAMIVFVAMLAYKFRGVQMIPGPVTTLNHNR